MVPAGKFYQHGGPEQTIIRKTDVFTRSEFDENAPDLRIAVCCRSHLLQPMVAYTAAHFSKKIVALFQRIKVLVPGTDAYCQYLLQFVHIGVKPARVIYIHRTVRPESRQYPDLKTILPDPAMVFEVIKR